MDSTYTRTVRIARDYPRRSQDAGRLRDATAAEPAVVGGDELRPVTMTTWRLRVATIAAKAQLGRTGTAPKPRDYSSIPGRRKATDREDAAAAAAVVCADDLGG